MGLGASNLDSNLNKFRKFEPNGAQYKQYLYYKFSAEVKFGLKFKPKTRHARDQKRQNAAK